MQRAKNLRRMSTLETFRTRRMLSLGRAILIFGVIGALVFLWFELTRPGHRSLLEAKTRTA